MLLICRPGKPAAQLLLALELNAFIWTLCSMIWNILRCTAHVQVLAASIPFVCHQVSLDIHI
jgi:hypothetical protein